MKLHFSEEGDGPLVVLLHGFPDLHQGWRLQIPALAAAGFRVIAPDLRGYGRSPAPRGIDAYSIPEVIADVAELIEERGGAPAVVVGHDWGGFAAWFLAMSRPRLVRKLVILNVPHPAVYSRVLKRSTKQKIRSSYQLFFQLPLLPELTMRLFGRMMMRRLGPFTGPELDTYERAWRGRLTPMLNYYRALRRYRAQLRAMIQPIDPPVLMIWGKREPVFLPETLEGTEEWTRGGFRLERIARAGHFVHRDAPERVNELLIAFSRA